MVHRDLKPANIIVGKFGEVYVLDWGLAKILGGKTLAKELGKSNPPTSASPVVVFITALPLHDPEIARGLSDLTKIDVFALGILLFEMLTLQPFCKEDITEIKTKLLEEPYRLPREIAPDRKVPKDLQAICMKALHRSRGHRFSNVRLFLEDLQGTDMARNFGLLVLWVGTVYPLEQSKRLPDHFRLIRNCGSRYLCAIFSLKYDHSGNKLPLPTFFARYSLHTQLLP